MNKVQIITFHNEINYGAALQAYALQKAIRNEGGTPYFPNIGLDKFRLKEHCSFKGKAMRFIARMVNYPKVRSFARFRKKEFIEEGVEGGECELIVCGSDQIWNPEITNGLQPYYFGKEAHCKKKISYAASCGKVSTIYDNIDSLKKLLSDFSEISVREEKTCLYLKQQGIECRTVVDPTLLIRKNDWIKLANKANRVKVPENYVFVYDLEGTKEFANIVNKVSEEKEIPVVTLRNRAHYNNEIKRFPKASPYEFLYLILNAEYVVSNSFHALVLSFIFEKKAYIVPHTKYAERMVSFLRGLNIELKGDKDIFVDFSEVDTSDIERFINESEEFLREVMENK